MSLPFRTFSFMRPRASLRWRSPAPRVNVSDPAVNQFTCEAIFSTLTNVDFDPARFVTLINDAVKHRDALKAKVQAAGGNVAFADGPATFVPAGRQAGMVAQGETVGVKSDPTVNPDILSLRELIVYGIKGLAAYADHARILGQEDEHDLRLHLRRPGRHPGRPPRCRRLVGLALKCGEVNLRAMELLDAGNTGTYGHPVPTSVPLGAKKGKAILVSGHDLKDLEIILKQTEGKGINVYTHGEMLPCHGYPELKKYGHFYGHYGTAWQNQAKEFAAFPGRHPHDHQLHPETQGVLQGQYLHHRPGGLARRYPHRRQRLHPGDQ
jgi:hydroxylamine reductase